MNVMLSPLAARLAPLVAALGRELVVVDVGAQTLEGEAHVYAPLGALGVPVRLIGFEPLAGRAAARRAEEGGGAEDGSVEIIEAFVGAGREEVFFENNASGTSSLLRLDAEFCAGFTSLAGLRTIASSRVRTERLDDLLGHVPAVDFLKLDIQGAELAALQGAASVLARTAMIQCEVEFAPIYQGQPLFSEVELFLRRAGFMLIDLVTEARRAPVVASGRAGAEQLLWADGVFVRRAELVSDDGLLAQAILAAALYDKPGIAERALANHDHRLGGRLAAGFAGGR